MAFKRVKELPTNTRESVRITTESGSVYEFGKAGPDLQREIRKAGIVLGYGQLTGIAEYPEHLDVKRGKGVFMGSSKLPDGRVVVYVEIIKIGDCLGAMLSRPQTGGLSSTPITRIEVER